MAMGVYPSNLIYGASPSRLWLNRPSGKIQETLVLPEADLAQPIPMQPSKAWNQTRSLRRRKGTGTTAAAEAKAKEAAEAEEAATAPTQTQPEMKT